MRLFIACLLMATWAVAAPQAKPKPKKVAEAAPVKPGLTIDHIMRGSNLYGYEPKEVRWSGDNQRLYFRWKQWTDSPEHDFDLYVVKRDAAGLRKLSDEEARMAPPLNPVQTRDRSQAIYTQSGDLWHYDYQRDLARPLTRTAEVEGNPRWILDGKRVAFTRGNNLYLLSLETGFIEQLTDIRAGAAPADPEKKGTDSQEFIKKEEAGLLEIVRRQQVFAQIVRPFLKELEFAKGKDLVRWWPLGTQRQVVLDPTRNFGRPIVNRRGVPTEVLARATAAW